MTRCVLVCAALLLLAVSAFSQGADTAVLSGSVSDPQGAVVSGAQVVTRYLATSTERSTTTNKDGLFALNNLAPGAYELQIKAAGFGPKIAQLNLEVGQEQHLNVSLQPQAQQTTINISDAAPLLNTSSSIVDGVINSQQIDSLPLNGRNFMELSLLIPGNTPAPNFDPTKSGTVVISTDGQLGRGSSAVIPVAAPFTTARS